MGSIMSPHASKAFTERYYLWYTPVWGAIAGLVMLTGWAEQWGDIPLMLFGVLLWLGVLLPPFFWRHPLDQNRPFYQMFHFKFQLWMFLFAFLGNYFGTAYFYEVLHMHYGFRTTWNVNHVPFFLYFLTVVYFTTYGVLLNLGYRWSCNTFSLRHPWSKRLITIPVALAVAALESALNANPFMKRLFCYDDLPFMLWFGTLMYGTWFVIAFPIWFTVDETQDNPTSLKTVCFGVLASFMLILCSMEFFKHVLAPLFTTVKHGAIGIGQITGTCLVPPPS